MANKYKKTELPKSVKLKGGIVAYMWDWSDDIHFCFISTKEKDFKADDKCVYIEEVEIDIPLKTKGMFDPKEGLIESIKEQREETLARHHIELKRIDDKLNQLLAIEYKESEQ